MLRLLTLAWLLLPALTFFEKNSQRYTQWRRVRRGGGYTAGQMTFHTYEAPLGRTVLAAATYLLTRTTPGSYHRLFDAMRKHIQLAPWSAETWHSVPTNNWAASASAVMYAADWRRLNKAKPGSDLHTYRQNIIHGFALASADFSRWLISQGRDPVPKRVLTRAQAMRKEAGFIFHRDTDPGRRTDPANPRDDFPWDEFFTEYDRLLGGATTIQEDDMPTIDELNKEFSRHAENIVAQTTKNVLTQLPAVLAPVIADEVRKQVAVQNTALHNMTKREIAAGLSALPGMDDEQVADRIGALLEDDLVAVLREAAAQLPEHSTEQIAHKAAEILVGRLTADINQEA